MAKATVAGMRAVIRLRLKSKAPNYLRSYIGRSIIRILAAEDALIKQGAEETMSPSMYRAMEGLTYLAKREEDSDD